MRGNKFMGEVIKINTAYIARAAFSKIIKVVRDGGIIIYPTDTIYGIGCDAYNEHAVGRVFSIKGRSENNPALILADSFRMVQKILGNISPRAKEVMKVFWPGPLTIVAKSTNNFHPLLCAQDAMIGIRIPASRFCLRLVKECGTPIVSTSVNRSGSPPLTQMHDIVPSFGRKVDYIIDAGESNYTLPSTVIRIDGNRISLIREGAIPRKMLTRYLSK
jgi:L-threonylcarbamoyladenylate synthase